MICKARTADTVLIKRKEMTGRTQALLRWLEGEGIKTTENKIHWHRWFSPETLAKRQATQHDCLPSLLGDRDKVIEKMYEEEQKFST
jgi:hypothetical protein